MSGGFFEGGDDGSIKEVPSTTTQPTVDNPTESEEGGLFDTTNITTSGTIPASGSGGTSTAGANAQEGGFFNGDLIPGTIAVQVGPKGDKGDKGDQGDAADVPQSIKDQINANTAKVSYPGPQDISGKQGTISDLTTIRSGAAAGATALQSHQDITGKADQSSLNTTNSAVALNTLKVTYPGAQDISGKVDTVGGEGLIKTPPTADGTYSYKVDNGTVTWETGSSGGGTSHYQAFKTINGTTLQWDDNVTSVPASLAAGWTIIDGLTSDTFSVTNNILQRGT